MFDGGVGGGDLAGLPIPDLGGLVADNALARRATAARDLVLAAAWADAHDRADAGPDTPLVERSCFYGGEGTPRVSEFCAGEFATLQQLPFHAGRAMIADALDLRHRMRLLWTATLAGEVQAWKAQKIAQATHALSWEAAADVDVAIAGLVESVPWTRFQRILQAAVLDADPEAAAARAERARTRRDVWVSPDEDGVKAVVARLDAGDATFFLATVNRLAEILKVRGDPDLIGPRRAKAAALLARPAEAAALLAAHRHDPDPADPGQPPTEPDDTRPEETGPDDDWPEETGPEEAGPEETRPEDAGPEDCEPEGTGPGEPGEPREPREPVEREGVAGLVEPWEPGTEPVPDPQAAVEEAHTSLPLEAGVFGSLTARDLQRARPRVVLYFHLSDAAIRAGHGLVRPEHGEPETLHQLKDWLTETGCVVQVRPVVIPADLEPVDGYEIPDRIRAAVRLRDMADTFPWGSCTAAIMDLDHSQSYVAPDHGGPPGQTGVDTLQPLTRTPHRAATHGQWRKRQPSPGVYVWRSPHGWIYLVTNHGSLALGRTAYAHAIWHAARPNENPAT